MRILVIGGGGREHALIWKLKSSPRAGKIYCAPGNGGIAQWAECLPDLSLDELPSWAAKERIDLTVIGPEVPLVAGLADRFEAAGLSVFGPSGAAARLEGSKAYAKEIMVAAGVPTAQSRVFTDFDKAGDYLSDRPAPYVIKADGLAAGKGVAIAPDIESARRALSDCLLDMKFGEAGSSVIIEDYLAGPEVSALAFVDGRTVRLMPLAQDYKRVGDGDLGPNTGGMGAYAPVDFVDQETQERIVSEVMRPVVEEMAARGVVYKGVLYAGLVLTDDGLKVLEFNTRFGDPETQVIMPLLESDLVDVMEACIQGTLDRVEPVWSADKSLTVILASEGYPEDPKAGREITGLDYQWGPDVTIFHAGTTLEGNRLITSGGRVIAVTAVGGSFSEARSKAYAAAERIDFEGRHYRRDIGNRGRSSNIAKTFRSESL
jgi:phosphoribosylamine---glycine ligase